EGNNQMMNYCLAQDLPTLVWAANLADLELTTSLAKKKDVARPTMMVFDLDPGATADIVQCCQVGLWLRDLLGGMRLKSFAKTSGSKGLQVYVPLNTPARFDQTKDLSRALAQLLEREHGNLVTSNMSKAVPKGKFGRRSKNISVTLGRDPDSLDLMKRHPFDLALVSIPKGKSLCPYHSHSAESELYLVVSGRGSIRDKDGSTIVTAGDAFFF